MRVNVYVSSPGHRIKDDLTSPTTKVPENSTLHREYQYSHFATLPLCQKPSIAGPRVANFPRSSRSPLQYATMMPDCEIAGSCREYAPNVRLALSHSLLLGSANNTFSGSYDALVTCMIVRLVGA